MTNPIIEEVRAARALIAAEHGYDRTKIIAWARAQQEALKMMNLKPHLVTTTGNTPSSLRTGKPIPVVSNL